MKWKDTQIYAKLGSSMKVVEVVSAEGSHIGEK